MFRFSISVLLFFLFVLFSAGTFAQSSDDAHVVHVQTNKFKATFEGDDAQAFSDMLRRQSETANQDTRLLSFRVLRHNWGADSRDLVIMSEFNNLDDLFSFFDDFNSMMEKAFSKEQLDADNALWNKYVGMHSDEIYREISGTRK